MISPLGMSRLVHWTTILLIGVCAGVGTGCGKKASKNEGPSTAADAAAANPNQAATGEEAVMAAIEKKDYDGGMAALAKLKDGITTDAQLVQFKTFCRKLSIKLQGAALTDPKAAEALAALRIMATGR